MCDDCPECTIWRALTRWPRSVWCNTYAKIWYWNRRRKLIKAAGGLAQYEEQCRIELERNREAWRRFGIELPSILEEAAKQPRENMYPEFMRNVNQ